MIPALIAAGLAIGSVLVLKRWNQVVGWLRDIIPKFKEVWARVRPHIPYEMQIMGDMVMQGVDKLASIIHKVYYQEADGQWMEEKTVRKVSENEVPAHIREKILAKKARMNEEVNISHEMELEMAS